MTRITDPCPACRQPNHRNITRPAYRYQAHRNDVEGSQVRDLVLAIVGVVVVITFIAWAEGRVPDVASFLAGVL